MSVHFSNQTTDATSTPEQFTAGQPQTLYVNGTFVNETLYVETARAVDGVYVPEVEFREPGRVVLDFAGFLRCRQLGSSGGSISVHTE